MAEKKKIKPVTHSKRCWCFDIDPQEFHFLEAELAYIKKELAETQDIEQAAKDELRAAGIKPKHYPLVLSKQEYQSRLEKAEIRIADHDLWCEYRKRLDLSFALGQLSGAIQGKTK